MDEPGQVQKVAQPGAGERTLPADKRAVGSGAQLHGDSDGGIPGIRQPGDGEAGGPHDGMAPPKGAMPVSYRIDSAGHRVPYGEVFYVVTKQRGIQGNRGWRMTLCNRCWLELER